MFLFFAPSRLGTNGLNGLIGHLEGPVHSLPALSVDCALGVALGIDVRGVDLNNNDNDNDNNNNNNNNSNENDNSNRNSNSNTTIT